MGPGYFPIVLGGLLIVFGLYVLAVGPAQRREASPAPGRCARSIVLPLSLVLFGLLMEHAGFVPAMLVLIFGSATASTEFRLVEVLLFSDRADRAVGRGVHLGARPALSADRRLRLTPSWISSTT